MSDPQILRRCPNCSASIRRSGSFCPKCGTPIGVATAVEGAGTPKSGGIAQKQTAPEPIRRDPLQHGPSRDQRVERSSQIMASGVSTDMSVRFLLVAIVLFMLFLVLLLVSQTMR